MRQVLYFVVLLLSIGRSDATLAQTTIYELFSFSNETCPIDPEAATQEIEVASVGPSPPVRMVTSDNGLTVDVFKELSDSLQQHQITFLPIIDTVRWDDDKDGIIVTATSSVQTIRGRKVKGKPRRYKAVYVFPDRAGYLGYSTTGVATFYDPRHQQVLAGANFIHLQPVGKDYFITRTVGGYGLVDATGGEIIPASQRQISSVSKQNGHNYFAVIDRDNNGYLYNAKTKQRIDYKAHPNEWTILADGYIQAGNDLISLDSKSIIWCKGRDSFVVERSSVGQQVLSIRTRSRPHRYYLVNLDGTLPQLVYFDQIYNYFNYSAGLAGEGHPDIQPGYYLFDRTGQPLNDKPYKQLELNFLVGHKYRLVTDFEDRKNFLDSKGRLVFDWHSGMTIRYSRDEGLVATWEEEGNKLQQTLSTDDRLSKEEIVKPEVTQPQVAKIESTPLNQTVGKSKQRKVVSVDSRKYLLSSQGDTLSGPHSSIESGGLPGSYIVRGSRRNHTGTHYYNELIDIEGKPYKLTTSTGRTIEVMIHNPVNKHFAILVTRDERLYVYRTDGTADQLPFQDFQEKVLGSQTFPGGFFYNSNIRFPTEGFARPRIGLITEVGKLVTPPYYDRIKLNAAPYSEYPSTAGKSRSTGEMIVSADGRTDVLLTDGTWLFPTKQYIDVTPIGADSYAVSERPGYWSVVDRVGTTIIPTDKYMRVVVKNGTIVAWSTFNSNKEFTLGGRPISILK